MVSSLLTPLQSSSNPSCSFLEGLYKDNKPAVPMKKDLRLGFHKDLLKKHGSQASQMKNDEKIGELHGSGCLVVVNTHNVFPPPPPPPSTESDRKVKMQKLCQLCELRSFTNITVSVCSVHHLILLLKPIHYEPFWFNLHFFSFLPSPSHPFSMPLTFSYFFHQPHTPHHMQEHT